MKTYDSNIDLQYIICNNDLDLYNKLTLYFISNPPDDWEHWDLIDKFYEHLISVIQQHDFRFLAFSVFSVYTHRATYDILTRLQSRIDAPIVLGGRGLSTRSNLSVSKLLSPTEKLLNFSDFIQKRKLATHLLIGDGEDAIVDLLNGSISEISNKHHVARKKTLDYPFSNFDDYELQKYRGVGNDIQLPVISSKGCVRACDFCDVAAQMSRFQSKDGNRLAEELVYLSERYGIREYSLADSIANGNMKELTKFCTTLTKYNQSVDLDKKISWTGNWISRPPNSIKSNFYDLLGTSGCKSLTIGAEHGSNNVLSAMQKKTVAEGVSFDLEQLCRLGIKSHVNIIVGHWSEKFEDFVKLYEFLFKLGRYIANGTINNMQLTMYNALDNTPSVDNVALSGIVRPDENFTLIWHSDKNPELTIKVRLARWAAILEFFHLIGIANREQWNSLINVTSRIKHSVDSWEEFFAKHIGSDHTSCDRSLSLLNNNMQYLENTIDKMYKTTPFLLKVNASHYNGAPRLFVKYNNTVLYDQYLDQGVTVIDLELTNQTVDESVLEIGMTGKNWDDTQVDEYGNIINDKNIIIEVLKLDTVDLTQDIEFFYNKIEHQVDGVASPPGPGLFKNNSSIILKYQNPFWKHYLVTRNHNTWYIDQHRQNQISNLIATLKNQITELKY